MSTRAEHMRWAMDALDRAAVDSEGDPNNERYYLLRAIALAQLASVEVLVDLVDRLAVLDRLASKIPPP